MISLKHLLIACFVCISVSAYSQFRLYEKGHDSYKAGKYDEAITHLTEYLTKATRDKAIDIDVFYIRALSHFKLNHFDQAIPDFEETILRGHSNKGNIYWFMAKCYDNLKNSSESVNYYDNAIRELRDKPESVSKLQLEKSQIRSRLGDLKQAYLDLREASAASPGNSELKKEMEKLEKQLGVEQVTALRKAEINVKESKSQPVQSRNQAKDEPKTVAKKDSPAEEAPKTTTPSTTKEDKPAPSVTNKQKTEAPVEVARNEPKPNVQQAATLSPLEELYRDEKRYALVIGNSAYPKQIGALKNPMNDASDIAKELTDSHFEVTLLTDATYGQIRAALMKFKEKLDGGEPEKTVGLFYYAGHGLQFEDENYLVPVDAAVEYVDDVPRYCFPINRMVLSNMERANTRMNIVILDACRNNPFPSLNRSLDNSGLGEMKRAKGSFIAYATSPGSVASDGVGRNGLYTQELLKALRKRGLTIEQVFKEVRANVLKLSGNKQNTWDSSNIVGEFHFKY
jgi:tetratricopeptide (TPR) repeat protein